MVGGSRRKGSKSRADLWRRPRGRQKGTKDFGVRRPYGAKKGT